MKAKVKVTRTTVFESEFEGQDLDEIIQVAKDEARCSGEPIHELVEAFVDGVLQPL